MWRVEKRSAGGRSPRDAGTIFWWVSANCQSSWGSLRSNRDNAIRSLGRNHLIGCMKSNFPMDAWFLRQKCPTNIFFFLVFALRQKLKGLKLTIVFAICNLGARTRA
jgi:hypothetical protein